MSNHIIPSKNRARVTSYGPFRGLEGTVQTVDEFFEDQQEPFCYYLIALEGASLPQPVWFESEEVELIDAPDAL